MSHFQAPPVAESVKYPAAVLGGRSAYFADPVFRTYRTYGATFYWDVVERVLARLIGTPAVGAGLARTILSLPRRCGDDLIVTLLHYVPLRKAVEGDVLEEPMSFAGQQFRLEGSADLTLRQFDGDVLTAGENKYMLPQVNGRLLLESLVYFTYHFK